jgi:hypothetical protein
VERIVSGGLSGVGYVEIRETTASNGRGCVTHPLSKIAVRINEGKASSGREVLARKHLDQGRFPDAGFSD